MVFPLKANKRLLERGVSYFIFPAFLDVPLLPYPHEIRKRTFQEGVAFFDVLCKEAKITNHHKFLIIHRFSLAWGKKQLEKDNGWSDTKTTKTSFWSAQSEVVWGVSFLCHHESHTPVSCGARTLFCQDSGQDWGSNGVFLSKKHE